MILFQLEIIHISFKRGRTTTVPIDSNTRTTMMNIVHNQNIESSNSFDDSENETEQTLILSQSTHSVHAQEISSQIQTDHPG